MSQRLHIGKTEESFYDCILENDSNVHEKLLSEWFCLRGGFFVGPWKIIIADTDLFDKLQSVFLELFTSLGKRYPDDVWVFYHDDRNIEHPTEEELLKWCEWSNNRTHKDAARDTPHL